MDTSNRTDFPGFYTLFSNERFGVIADSKGIPFSIVRYDNASDVSEEYPLDAEGLARLIEAISKKGGNRKGEPSPRKGIRNRNCANVFGPLKSASLYRRYRLVDPKTKE